MHRRSQWSDNRIFIPGLDGSFHSIYAPDDITTESSHYIRTYNLFCHQSNAFYMRRELELFLKAARDSHYFLDLGSAEGFYSALFSSIHGSRASILSVDCGCSSGCVPSHSEIVRKLNSSFHNPKRWDLVRAYVTSSPMTPPLFDLPKTTSTTTLSDLLTNHEFTPDLIKIDIESSEYEVLLSSISLLSNLKPKLLIEIHNDFLKARGLSFSPVLQALYDIGYRISGADSVRYLSTPNCHILLQPK